MFRVDVSCQVRPNCYVGPRLTDSYRLVCADDSELGVSAPFSPISPPP